MTNKTAGRYAPEIASGLLNASKDAEDLHLIRDSMSEPAPMCIGILEEDIIPEITGLDIYAHSDPSVKLFMAFTRDGRLAGWLKLNPVTGYPGHFTTKGEVAAISVLGDEFLYTPKRALEHWASVLREAAHAMGVR